jgi:hypothetical protein
MSGNNFSTDHHMFPSDGLISPSNARIDAIDCSASQAESNIVLSAGDIKYLHDGLQGRHVLSNGVGADNALIP